MKCPSTLEEWKAVAKGFLEKWQSPHTLGSLDGKHIRIKAPPKSGSKSFNYKGFFSFVLMGLVDSGYHFLCVNVGQPGSNSDGGTVADIINATLLYWLYLERENKKL